jgi:hypothetical protein
VIVFCRKPTDKPADFDGLTVVNPEDCVEKKTIPAFNPRFRKFRPRESVSDFRIFRRLLGWTGRDRRRPISHFFKSTGGPQSSEFRPKTISRGHYLGKKEDGIHGEIQSVGVFDDPHPR